VRSNPVACLWFKNSKLKGADPQRQTIFISFGMSWLGGFLEKLGLTGFRGTGISGQNRVILDCFGANFGSF
jgi:hypothetical protein